MTFYAKKRILREVTNMQSIQKTVRLLLIDEQGRMLLVRKATTQLWHWPGGKCKPTEKLTRALVREVFEETGLGITKLKLVHTEHLPTETIYCYTAISKTTRCKKPDGIEIDRICRRSLKSVSRIPLTETQKRLLQNVAIIAEFV